MANVIDVVMQLTDRVTAPLRGIREQMEQTANANRRLGDNIRNAGRGMTSIGTAMLPMAGAIVAAGAAGAKTFMDFDATITAAGVKASATAEEMEEMRRVAGRLGADFPISAAQAAEGMDRLAAGGFNANQTIAAMPGIIKAAIASGEELGATSDVVTSALSIWNLTTGDVAANTEHVADVIQMSANVSKLGMQEFGLAMQYAGAPAAALHVSIEELGTAMAIMSNNGIEASAIGTSLRATFSRLSRPPKDAAAAIAALGLKVRDSSGNFVGLTNIVDQMRTSMAGLSDIQQVAMAKAIAGGDAYSGLLALIRTSPEAYQELAGAIQNAAGSSTAAYNTMQDTLKGSIDSMKGSVEAFAISMGAVLAPTIRDAAGAIKSIADTLSALSPEQQHMIVQVGAAVLGFTAFFLIGGKAIGVLGTLIGLYGNIGRVLAGHSIRNKLLEYSVRGLQGAYHGMGTGAHMMAVYIRTAGEAALTGAGRIRAFTTSLTFKSAASGAAAGIRSIGRAFLAASRASLAFVFSPIGLVLTTIAAAAYLVYSNWDKIAPVFARIGRVIQGAFGAAILRIMPAIRAFQAACGRVRVLVGGTLIAAFRRIQKVFADNAGAINVLKGVFATIAAVIGGPVVASLFVLANIATGVVVAAINIVAAVISAFIGVLSGIITFITGVFTGNWSMAWDGVVQIFSSIFGGIEGICMGVLEGIKAAINGVIAGINGINVTIPEWVPGIGGRSFGPLNIPLLYTGVDNWPGGLAAIHDRGAEIVDLPRGARVYPHDESMRMYGQMRARTAARDAAADRMTGARSSYHVTVNMGGVTVRSDSGTDIKTLGTQIARELMFQIEKHAINAAEGAI